MIEERLLEASIARGILTSEQVDRLRELSREMNGRPEPSDDEKLRFISGFGDIFVALGIVLFVGSTAYLSGHGLGAAATWTIVAGLAWLLAEFFTRKRRMALPSILLLLIFALSAFMSLAFIVDATGPHPGQGWVVDSLGLDVQRPGLIAVAALLAAGLVAVHYYRFRVPITIAAGAAALAGCAIAGVFAVAPDFAGRSAHLLVLACGLAVFAAAMRFDLSDPARLTRRTDVAFWLHLLAAPLIVHPLVAVLLAGLTAPPTSAALAVLLVFLLLGFVAVLIDRRALLVSGLAYAGYAFATLISQAGIVGQTAPATMLALGAFVLLLSAGWRPLRAALLRILPIRLSDRLPNPMTSR